MRDRTSEIDSTGFGHALMRGSPEYSSAYQLVKRTVDIVLGLVVVTTVLPLMCVLLWLAQLLTGGPLLFLQWRHGHLRRWFRCKFRTMRSDDGLVRAIGRILGGRVSNEVPQFLNVLAGDMSVVGPRPHVVEHDEF